MRTGSVLKLGLQGRMKGSVTASGTEQKSQRRGQHGNQGSPTLQLSDTPGLPQALPTHSLPQKEGPTFPGMGCDAAEWQVLREGRGRVWGVTWGGTSGHRPLPAPLPPASLSAASGRVLWLPVISSSEGHPSPPFLPHPRLALCTVCATGEHVVAVPSLQVNPI